MPNLYVITILNYDPFGYDYMVYNICNRCKEVPELQYEDGLSFIYFYTDGTKGGTPEMKAMLQYFKNSTQNNVIDATTRKLHDYTEKIKIQPEVRDAFMKFEDIIYYERRDAILDTKIQDICELLEEHGEIPEELKNRLDSEKDVNRLADWLKLAAKSHSIEEFMEAID